MRTVAMQIAQMRPGDSIDVTFPIGFEVSYKRRRDGEITTTELARMNAYYWDDDDHRTKDYYFYDEEGNRFAKQYDLTDESREKVWEFIRTV